jgi:PleD family two-component response regulator
MLEVIAIQAAQAILRARLFEQTERLATTDGLTGLLNHRSVQGKLDEELARAARMGRKVTLLLTDIDHFKSVNDTYGHATGDHVLKEIAKILSGCARSMDIVARYGGEVCGRASGDGHGRRKADRGAASFARAGA